MILPDAGPYNPDEVYDVPLKLIFADEVFNVRGAIDPLDVFELAKEIKLNGLLQPVTIQPYKFMPEKRFRLVAGYRRYKAHQVNDQATIRALIKENLTDLDARLFNLTENTQRTNLNILQEANAIQHFKLAGWTQEQVAAKVGKSRGWAQVRFMLLELPYEIQMEVASGMINQADVREIWSLSSYDSQIDYVKHLKDAKLKGLKKKPKPESVIKQNETEVRKPEEVQEMQDLIQENTSVDNFAAIALGWQQGFVDDYKMHNRLAEEARKNGKFYMIPAHLKTAASAVST